MEIISLSFLQVFLGLGRKKRWVNMVILRSSCIFITQRVREPLAQKTPSRHIEEEPASKIEAEITMCTPELLLVIYRLPIQKENRCKFTQEHKDYSQKLFRIEFPNSIQIPSLCKYTLLKCSGCGCFCSSVMVLMSSFPAQSSPMTFE